jgi:hypothetical protein
LAVSVGGTDWLGDRTDIDCVTVVHNLDWDTFIGRYSNHSEIV